MTVLVHAVVWCVPSAHTVQGVAMTPLQNEVGGQGAHTRFVVLVHALLSCCEVAQGSAQPILDTPLQ